MSVATLAPVMQVIGVPAIGYLLTASGVINPQDADAAKRWGVYILTPVTILQSFSRSPPSQLTCIIAALAASLLTLVSFGVSWIASRGRHRVQRALLLGSSIGGAFESTAIPLMYLLAGPVAVQLSAVAGLVHAVSVSVGSYWLCSTSQAAYPKKYRHEDGGLYNGQWQGRNKQGLGTYLYPGGAKYKGEWRNNFKEGRGVYTFPKGGSYEGEWRAGNRAGLGVRTLRSGKVLAGQWDEGQLAVPMEEWQCAVAAESAHSAAQAASRVPVGGAEAGIAVQQVLMTPALLATVAGIALSLFQIALPPTAQRVTDILAVANAPLMLLTFGASLDFRSIPASQWQDVCLVAAVRYCPGLLLLAIALGTGTLGTALPLPYLAAIGVTLVSSLTPIPSQMMSYVQRFNLSKSLATNITKFCSWVSSSLLVALLLATSASQNMKTDALQDLPHMLPVAQSSVIAVAVAAAVLLVVSVPFAAQRVQSARRQEQQKTQSSASISRQADGQPESEHMDTASVGSGQERELSLSEALGQKDTVTALDSQKGGGVHDNDKNNDTSSDSKRAHSDDSIREAIDAAEAQAASNTASAQPPDVEPGTEAASAPQQLPTGSDDTADYADKTDNKPKDGFFRDVSADCMQRQRQCCWRRQRRQRAFMPRICAQHVCLRRHFVTVVASKTPLQVVL